MHKVNLADRLRSVIRPGPVVSPEDAVTTPGFGACSTNPAHDPGVVLDGQWVDRGGQRFLVIDRRYPPGHRHGHSAVVDSAPDAGGCWPSLSVLEPALKPGRMLFIDLETTGLAGGAGTYAFLVGCGWFENGGFRIRQFLLTGFAAEKVLLQAIADIAEEAGGIGTFNGKTFDLPLIETRFLLNRMRAPLAAIAHVDMLHPARRLWRDDSCKLTVLERTLLGHVREGDVPGFEIPGRYFHFVRSGDARPLAAVLEHNRLDILSLALLTARMACLLADGAAAVRSGQEALGLGRVFERASQTEAAAACFEAAALLGEDAETVGEALRASAVILRRARRYEEAARLWQQILQLRPCPSRLALQAVEALAVHHEHRARELDAARHFALQSLGLSSNQTGSQAARHRLARLDRKLRVSSSAVSRTPHEVPPLF